MNDAGKLDFAIDQHSTVSVDKFVDEVGKRRPSDCNDDET